MEDNSPAALSIRFAITSADIYRGRRGRPRMNLLSTIQNDLKEHDIALKTVGDLDAVKMLITNMTNGMNI